MAASFTTNPVALDELLKACEGGAIRLGTDAFAVFAETLVDPSAFIGRTIEQVFGLVMAEMPHDPWAAYLSGRYTFLASAPQIGAG